MPSVAVSVKTPGEFDRELRRKQIEVLFVEAVELGRLMTEIVADNADKVAKALGIEYDTVRVWPAHHSPWERDLMFYHKGSLVLSVEVKTVLDPDRFEATVRRLVKDIRLSKVTGLIAVGAGYKKKGERREDLGLLMIILTPEYVDNLPTSEIIEDIMFEIERTRQKLGLESLKPVHFRDKFIMRLAYYHIQIEKELARLRENMATKEDVARLERRIDKLENGINELKELILKSIKEKHKEKE